jgi:dTDP-4-dehydrorhamnose 3,5-epimerase
MIFTPLEIAGAYRIDPVKIGDERGFFARIFCAEEFAAHGLSAHWKQMNTSFSARRGTLRGLHFQRPPAAEAKLVRCLGGAMYDVLVDLRAGSNTFGRWTALELTPRTGAMVYIPEGVAHGFQRFARIPKCCTAIPPPISASITKGGLCFDDRTVGIAWPLPVSTISERDRSHPGHCMNWSRSRL